MTLRNRFTLLFVAFAVLITALEGWLAWSAADRSLEEQMDRALREVASVVADQFSPAADLLSWLEPGAEDSPNYKEFQGILQRLVQSGYIERADYFRWSPGAPAARALVSSRPSDSVSIGQELFYLGPRLGSEIRRAMEVGSATSEPFIGVNGQTYKFGFVRVDPPAVADGSPQAGTREETFLAVLMSATYADALESLRWRIVSLSAIAAALAGLIGWRVAGWIVARLETLSRAALRIQRGWMDRPVELPGEDELGRLARAMERMRTGIRRRDEQLRRMLSQVAHEIRNPLGGLELFAAAAQDTEDPAERRRILARVRKEVVGLSGIINEFLGFARPDRSQPKLHDVRVPVEEAASLVGAELRENGGTLEVNLPRQPLQAIADPAKVKRGVLNLVRNAFQAGNRVWVEGRTIRGEVRISVRDDGPGVAPELRERIFEPFVGDKEQGAGLGLAIVKQLAEADGGRVVLADSPGDGGEGAEFHLYLISPESLPAGGGSSFATRKSPRR